MTIDEIVDTYYLKIYKLCLFYLKDEQEAEEILQEVFIKVMHKFSSFEGKSSLYTWLYRIAINTVLNHIKRKKLVAFISLENPRGPDYNDTPGEIRNNDPAILLEQDQEYHQKIAFLEQCMETLSSREKTAFYLYHYETMKQKEIARVMKTSISAVEALLYKSKKKIKQCAAKYETK